MTCGAHAHRQKHTDKQNTDKNTQHTCTLSLATRAGPYDELTNPRPISPTPAHQPPNTPKPQAFHPQLRTTTGIAPPVHATSLVQPLAERRADLALSPTIVSPSQPSPSDRPAPRARTGRRRGRPRSAARPMRARRRAASAPCSAGSRAPRTRPTALRPGAAASAGRGGRQGRSRARSSAARLATALAAVLEEGRGGRRAVAWQRRWWASRASRASRLWARHRGRLLELVVDTATHGVFDVLFGLVIEAVGLQAVAGRSQGGELGARERVR